MALCAQAYQHRSSNPHGESQLWIIQTMPGLASWPSAVKMSVRVTMPISLAWLSTIGMRCTCSQGQKCIGDHQPHACDDLHCIKDNKSAIHELIFIKCFLLYVSIDQQTKER